jgi:hypothetical protein
MRSNEPRTHVWDGARKHFLAKSTDKQRLTCFQKVWRGVESAFARFFALPGGGILTTLVRWHWVSGHITHIPDAGYNTHHLLRRWKWIGGWSRTKSTVTAPNFLPHGNFTYFFYKIRSSLAWIQSQTWIKPNKTKDVNFFWKFHSFYFSVEHILTLTKLFGRKVWSFHEVII